MSDGVTAINEPVLDAASATSRVLMLTCEILREMTVRPERMKQLALIGFGTATELADVIVRETGLSFRLAHNIVAMVVTQAIEAHRTADQITADDLIEAGKALLGRRLPLRRDVIEAALNPVENLDRRTITGGPAPVRMDAMWASRNAALVQDAAKLGQIGATLAARRAVFAKT